MCCVNGTASPQASAWPDSPAIAQLKEQLATAEAETGTLPDDLVKALFRLADAYREEAGYVPATPYVERALSVTEKAHGSEDINVAATLDKLGTLYLSQGDTAQARAAYVRAKPILLRKLGRKHPGFGIFLLHVGRLQVSTGQIKDAQETAHQAVTAFGDDLSHAAQEMTEVNRMLGLLLLGVGRYKEAEQQLVYALTVRSEALSFVGRDEALLYMAPAQAALGELYVTMGRNDQAQQPLLDALTAYEKKYGGDHPVVEEILIALAALYENKGDAAQGQQYAARVQALHQRSEGYSHLPGVSVRVLRRSTPP
jgi:tetratricopeptide (TPR) repeat protein